MERVLDKIQSGYNKQVQCLSFIYIWHLFKYFLRKQSIIVGWLKNEYRYPSLRPQWGRKLARCSSWRRWRGGWRRWRTTGGTTSSSMVSPTIRTRPTHHCIKRWTSQSSSGHRQTSLKCLISVQDLERKLTSWIILDTGNLQDQTSATLQLAAGKSRYLADIFSEKFCPCSPVCTVQVSRMLKGSQVGGCAPVLVTFNTFAEVRPTFV